MKHSLLLALILFVALATVAYAAQDAPPDHSQDLVNGVIAVVAAVAALVSSALINLVKQLPYLGDDDKDKLATAVTQIVAVVVSVVTGYVTALVAQGLGLIDDTGLRAMAVAALTPVLAEVRYRLVKLAPAGKG